MIVKICGIMHLDDAEVAIRAGATALGFNFYRQSPRYVSPETASRLAALVPVGVLKVGVFVNEDPSLLAETMRAAGLDIAQVIGDAPHDGTPYWRAYKVDEQFSAGGLDETAEAHLLDTPSRALHGGTGQTFDWTRARIPGQRIVIAGGLGPDNVGAAIRASEPWGVDACSRLESSPGRKDPEKVRAFIAAALSV
jgi:phosphoribosylanthranilate isomerase